MESLIIFGGSFDPIHNAHLRIARAASLQLNANVVFVPAKSPRWKSPSASTEDRVAMLKLAIKEEGSPAFSIDLTEINSIDEVNYSIDTVRRFHKKYPKAHLYYLIGADQANAFDKWKDAEELAKLATPLYVSRPGYELNDDNLVKYHMKRLPYDKSGYVSSSDIRTLRSIDVPLSVRDYIEKHGLYYIRKIAGMMSLHRLAHSISVANLAYYIAARNQVIDYQKAYIAGLLHDCAKGLPKAKELAMMKEHFPDLVKEMPQWTYHQYLGTVLAKTEFGIEDEAVLDAICYHASGKPHMTPIGKIIYSSDKIEPTRGYNSKPLINKCVKNYYVGFLKVLQANRDYLNEQGYQIDNPMTKKCMELYLGVK
ncbi:MAG: nicotinate (nicotinamide) nucleotide adenylyltransferase [Bacilli bacterium]|nr:nicotinate (nicotinamide) nucleotide adenylyltransferase [Bacilli bacterium]